MDDQKWRANVKALIQQTNPQYDVEIDEFQDASFYWGPENFRMICDWLDETLAILEDPDRFSNRDVFTVFFGTIFEMIKFLKIKTFHTLKKIRVDETNFDQFVASIPDPLTREYFNRVWDAMGMAEIISTDFTDDEKFILKFLRHRKCHITLSDFTVKLTKEDDNGILKFNASNWKQLESLSKTVSVKDFRNRLVAKLMKHIQEQELDTIRDLLTHEEGDRLFPE